METIEVKTASEVVGLFNSIAASENGNDFVFRGQNDAKWKLESTFNRYSTSRLFEFRNLAFEQLLNEFENCLAQLGEAHNIKDNRRGRLEYARHCGVPSPLIDFSRSPFIALWFAFNGIKGSSANHSHVAVYALNWRNLGGGFSNFCNGTQLEMLIANQFKRSVIDVYQTDFSSFFENQFPENMLKFLHHPASWNKKMQQQMGCFIYDNIYYQNIGAENFEDLIIHHPKFSNINILTKYKIPTMLARDIFNILDIYGINGTRLMGDYTGAVFDVFNSYNYSPRNRAWDLATKD